MKSIIAISALVGSAYSLFVPATVPAGSTSVAQVGGEPVTVVAESTSVPAATATRESFAPQVAATAAVGSTGYSCPSGQYLTYGIASAALPGITLQRAQAYFQNWAADAPGPKVKSSGSGSPGATRSWIFTNASIGANFTVNEILNQVIQPTSGNSNLEQRWSIQSTETYNNGQLQFFQAWKDLTIGEDSKGAVHLQLYENVCANNQQLALQSLPTILNQQLNFWVNAPK